MILNIKIFIINFKLASQAINGWVAQAGAVFPWKFKLQEYDNDEELKFSTIKMDSSPFQIKLFVYYH